ncbi:MAG TPA: Holliday junction resolvase RuvX [Synergistaceae bacterium]|nr:Holliday junction resolvase RuvX [Synergistaceae bacterium]HPQ36934.1 Holliday junction resolvase RuvX [Synergistaceae bacterium]
MAKRILCLDIGAVRIGVALSDPLGMFAQGVAVLSAKGKWKIELDALMERHEVALLLVGLPLRTDGSRGPEARRILDMVHALKERYPSVEVRTWDERYSTVTAHQSLKERGFSEERRRGMVDKTAAAVILQSFLDSRQS